MRKAYRRRRKRVTSVMIGAIIAVGAILWALILVLLVYENNRANSSDETGVTSITVNTDISDTTSVEPSDSCVLTQQSDGSIVMTWPALSGASSYQVELTWEDENGESLYQTKTKTNSCVLPGLGDVGECTLKIQTDSGFLFTKTILKASVDLSVPGVTDVVWSLDGNMLSAVFSMEEGDVCSVCLMEDGQISEEIMTVDTGLVDLVFGVEGGILDLPDQDEEYTIGLCVSREGDGFKYYGLASSSITVSREDLLGREMDVDIAYNGSNVYTFTWNETKGAYYRIQRYNTSVGAWLDVDVISADEELSYTTPHLKAFDSYTYRIVAEGGQVDSTTGYAAMSGEILCTTEASVVFCTVWPAYDLIAYSDAGKTRQVGTATAMQAYCVIEEEQNGMFAILLDGETAYVDSSYCLINLTDYLGSLCSYDITNSYSSKFMVHEFEFPGVTGETVVGFEDVELDDGTFVVPLLYPVANKLMTAAKDALKQGYRLKIYESYRPQIATTTLYSMAEVLLDETIPETTYTGVEIESLNLPSTGTVIETVTAEDGSVTEVETEGKLTYRDIMLGNYTLTYYLAQGRSKHNSGIALDLTLEDADTGEELQMQTSMHDLSHYSNISENNANANLLASIMKGAGFSTLVSEWWHFQDNDSTQTSTMVAVAADIEGWKADDNGYMYCKSDGSFYAACTVTIDGVSCEFDSDGYLVSGF